MGFFKSILLLSCVGTVLTCILLIIKPFTKKVLSTKWQYYIWLAVLVSMVLPISVKLPKMPSIQNVTIAASSPIPSETAEETMRTVEFLSENAVNIPTGEAITVAELEKKRFNYNIYDILAFAWILGVFIFILCAAISYIRFLFQNRAHSTPCEGCEALTRAKEQLKIMRNIPLRKSTIAVSPMLVGVFRPVIYVPDREISDDALRMIFTHELMHYKRHDLLYKWFALIVNAMHWFNPAAYMAAREIGKACELSCDEIVTKNMSDEEKKIYMQTILGLANTSA